MHMLRNTEYHINNIVDRGQRELQERKVNRLTGIREGSVSPTTQIRNEHKENISSNHPLDSRSIDEKSSSLSEISIQSRDKYDSLLIEKHRQVKQEFEDYKQSYGGATSNVFSYQKQGASANWQQ